MRCRPVPIDESFRFTVVLKGGLTITKAFVTSSPHIQQDDRGWITASCVIVWLAVGWITLAFKAHIAWQWPKLLYRVHHPRVWIICYALNFLVAQCLSLIAMTARLDFCGADSKTCSPPLYQYCLLPSAAPWINFVLTSHPQGVTELVSDTGMTVDAALGTIPWAVCQQHLTHVQVCRCSCTSTMSVRSSSMARLFRNAKLKW